MNFSHLLPVKTGTLSPGDIWDTISRAGSAKCDPKLLSVNQKWPRCDFTSNKYLWKLLNAASKLNLGGSLSCACRTNGEKLESLLHLSSDICGVELQLNIQYLKQDC